MLSSETLRIVALEILKAKCDLQTTNEKEILETYYSIWLQLKKTNKTFKNEDAIKFLK